MKVELKTIKLTKSKILQMEYITYPQYMFEVLGWVNIDKKRYVIVKMNGCYYRTEFFNKIDYEVRGTQISDGVGGYEYPSLTHITCETINRGYYVITPDTMDEKNIKLYHHLKSFKRQTEIAEQIYY